MRRWIFLLLVSVIWSCSNDSKKTSEPEVFKLENENGIIDVKFKKEVLNLDSRPDIQVTEINADNLVIVAGNDSILKVGDYIAGSQSPGFFRQIETIEKSGETTVLNTRNARLEDVLESGLIDLSIPLGSNPQPPDSFVNDQKKSAGGGGPAVQYGDAIQFDSGSFCFDALQLSGEKFDDIAGGLLSVEVERGESLFCVSVHPLVSIWDRLYQFSIRFRQTNDLKVNVKLNAGWDVPELKVEKTFKRKSPLTMPEQVANPLCQLAWLAGDKFLYCRDIKFMVGPVPVDILFKLYAKIGFSVYVPYVSEILEMLQSVQFSYETSSDARYELGVKKERGVYSSINQKSFEYSDDFLFENPLKDVGDFQIKFYVKPEISLELYGVAGPYFNVVAYLKGVIYDFLDFCMDAFLGFELNWGVRLDVFSLELEKNYSFKPEDYRLFRYCPCQTADTCPNQWGCVGGVCDACRIFSECATGMTCQSGECIPCEHDYQCTSSQICISGLCTSPVCGDGVVSPGEECDTENLLGQTCEALGYYGGQLGCENCAYDEGACDLFGRCGDGIRQAEYGEICDGGDVGGQSCESRGFGSGVLACTAGCLQFDTSGCSYSPTCGNGSVEPADGELCDGADLGGKTCQSLPNGFYGGPLQCGADCASYDTSQCERCGDGVIQEEHEQCDGAELAGASCASLEMGTGALACTSECLFDTTGCTNPPVCGDGVRNSFTEVCDGTQFAPGENCEKYGFYEGSLTCNGCTAIDTSACTGQCGDGVVQDIFGEQCEGDITSTTCDDWGSTGPGVPQCVQCKVRGCPRYSAISTGDNHACAITPTRSAVCWGYNRYGQLGDGQAHEMCDYYDCSATPVVVSGLADVISIAAGLDFSCAVTGDGYVWCWGQNTNGKLGIGNTTDQPLPVQVLGPGGTGVLENALMVTAGEQHACALRSDGTVWCWGYNNYGMLGNSTSTTSYFPVQAGTLNQAEQIVAGKEHTCALLNTGAVWCWGRNESGQLGNGSTSTFNYPRQVSGPAGVGFLSGITQIDLGASFTCAVKDDQTAWCWGINNYGQLGLGHTSTTYYPAQVTQPGGGGGMSGVTSISAGQITCALRSDDSLYCWGQGGTTSVSYATLLSPYCAAFACPFPLLIEKFSGAVEALDNSRNDYSCAILADGSAWCWGRNQYGQLGNGALSQRNTPMQVANLGSMRAISTAYYHSCAVGQDDRVWCWGYNGSGQLGDGTKNYTYEPKSVVGSDGSGYLEDVFSVCATGGSSCALKHDGTVWCWGYNANGQLGNGTTIESLVPAQVVGIDGIGLLEGVRNLSCRAEHYCVSFDDNTTACWGTGGCYTLGISGGTLFPKRPTTVNSGAILTDVSTIVTGGDQTFVLKTDGTFWLWGGIFGCGWPNCKIEWNTIQVLTQATGVQRISAGDRHACVVNNLGEVHCHSHSGTCSGTWQNYGVLGNGLTTGDQTYSQVIGENGIGTFSSGTRVAAGDMHTCASKMDGTVVCWGRNNLGQLGDGLYHYQCSPNSSLVDCVSYPVPVTSLTNVTELAAGTDHTCAVKNDGTVWCWGYNYYNQLGDGIGAFKLDPTRVVETW